MSPEQAKQFVQVPVLEDSRPIVLCFADERSARCFVQLIRLYQYESGAGNGYSAYWYFGVPLTYSDQPVGIGQVDLDLVTDMVRKICGNRLALPHGDRSFPIEYLPEVSMTGSAICFDFDPDRLPPRQAPAVGDLALVFSPDSPYVRRLGRVKEIRGGESVVLAPCTYGLEAETVLPYNQVMKIHDFLKGK